MNHDDPNEGTGTPGWIVPVLLIVCLVVIVSVMSGCAPGGGSTPHPRANTAPVAPAAASRSTADVVFLTALSGAPYAYGHTDANMIDTGKGVCSRLDQGGTALTAVSYVTAAGYGDAAPASYLVGAAIGAYCPKYAGAL